MSAQTASHAAAPAAHREPSHRRPVALVTGSRRGLGRAFALALAAAGFDVALMDVAQSADLTIALAQVQSLGGRGVAVAADLADVCAHERLLDDAERALGPLDCLVNTAGVSVLDRGDVLDVTPDAYDRCLDINTRGTFFLTQAYARHQLHRPVGRAHRSIVTITSSNARAVSTHRGEYCVSKPALSMVSSLFAVRLGGAEVGVYEVQPGLIDTSIGSVTKARYDEDIANGWLVDRRWGRPEDVARVVATLALGRLPYTAGQRIAVDGGMLIQKY